MIWNIKKFNKEISALKAAENSAGFVSGNSSLHPLRKSQIKQEMLSKIETAPAFAAMGETNRGEKRYIWQERKNNMIKYIISTILGLTLVGGAVSAASNNAKPGDVLFPVKKATENIQLQLSASEQARAELQAKFAEERINDAKDLNVKTGASAQLKSEVKVEAKDEVSGAISALQKVQAKLQAKGNLTAAAKINETIVDLKTKATAEQIDSEEIKASENNSGSAAGDLEINDESSDKQDTQNQKDLNEQDINDNANGNVSATANTNSGSSVNVKNGLNLDSKINSENNKGNSNNSGQEKNKTDLNVKTGGSLNINLGK